MVLICQEALQLLRSHQLDNSESNSIGEGKVKKLYNSFESSADPRENNNSSMKPLWKHMSEELLLADMDPNVVSSFRRAMSSRQLGMNQSKILRPLVGSSSRVSPLSDYRNRLPGTEDKIVVYFTSLRGIRRTYEDCCAFWKIEIEVHFSDNAMSPISGGFRSTEVSTLLQKPLASFLATIVAEQWFCRQKDGLRSRVSLFPLDGCRGLDERCNVTHFLCGSSRFVEEEEESERRARSRLWEIWDSNRFETLVCNGLMG
ncbi:uncharacterized protein LOC122665459 [Telopea speciosissima]|uniref:uncharacterized protein LOC122665459 n=1 Tax=Telopea speciosissima TaxID=54955 RepID=UPI001CC38C47|nr:uncharacterized protein LOC122665459 [Telopea speciosissima]